MSRRTFVSHLGTGLTFTAIGASQARPVSGRQAQTVNKDLIFRSEDPRNAEPSLDKLVASWITPVEHFYVRSHAPVPRIDLSSFRVTVEGLVNRPLQLSLAELQNRFDQVSVIATMTCAGNRRNEHSRIKTVSGVQWDAGAIGNSRWGGVRLSEILKRAEPHETARHVWFEGLDQIPRGDGVIPFGGSIPIEKAMQDTDAMPGAIVATTMGGQPLPPDHGFPARTVVPGYIGARSVKWLGKIVVSDRPSPNHYVADAYKVVEQGDEVEWAEAGIIYRYPLNSVICSPTSGWKAKAGTIAIQGYALPTGTPGNQIATVEVSSDAGRTWLPASLTSATREYCWTLWKADVPVTAHTTRIVVRAIDSAGHTQPETVAWNLKGYLFNAWHGVDVQPES